MLAFHSTRKTNFLLRPRRFFSQIVTPEYHSHVYHGAPSIIRFVPDAVQWKVVQLVGDLFLTPNLWPPTHYQIVALLSPFYHCYFIYRSSGLASTVFVRRWPAHLLWMAMRNRGKCQLFGGGAKSFKSNEPTHVTVTLETLCPNRRTNFDNCIRVYVARFTKIRLFENDYFSALICKMKMCGWQRTVVCLPDSAVCRCSITIALNMSKSLLIIRRLCRTWVPDKRMIVSSSV